jgi:hypothetical protein
MGPSATAWRIAEAVNLIVSKMETTEDLAYTSRIALVFDMFIPSWQPTICVNLDAPGAYISRGVLSIVTQDQALGFRTQSSDLEVDHLVLDTPSQEYNQSMTYGFTSSRGPEPG